MCQITRYSRPTKLWPWNRLAGLQAGKVCSMVSSDIGEPPDQDNNMIGQHRATKEKECIYIHINAPTES